MSWFNRGPSPWQQPPDAPSLGENHPESAGLHDRFNKSQDWQDALHRKAAHAALNQPDEMGVNVDNRKFGLGGWPLVAAIGGLLGAGTMGAGLIGVLAYLAGKQPLPTSPPPPTATAPAEDRYNEYEIELPNADK